VCQLNRWRFGSRGPYLDGRHAPRARRELEARRRRTDVDAAAKLLMRTKAELKALVGSASVAPGLQQEAGRDQV
jgi:hypothetical protein